MAQTLVRPENLKRTSFRLDGDEAHHVVRVLRKIAGDEIDLFDGKSRRCRAIITAVDPNGPTVEGRIIRDLESAGDRYKIRLFQGVPKGSKVDYVIEKAVELGADQIIMFTSRYCQVKFDEKSAPIKNERWKRLVEAAAKQCERSDIPVIWGPTGIETVPDYFENTSTLVFSVSPAAAPLKDVLKASFSSGSGVVNIIIGPESGLSEEEEAALVKAGGHLVSMGPRVLRTETAGLAALAILQHELAG